MSHLERFMYFLLIPVFPFSLPAGESTTPMKWGEVPTDQLAMKTFATDSNATAVVLCDYGEVTFNYEYDLIYRRHRRIKILTQAGFDWGTHVISYYVKDRTQRVRNLEGQTITLGAKGEVITKELDDDDIFEEEVGENWERMKFTLPALAPGCVIEYRYTVESTNPHYMPDWSFQTTEPVLWSEFRVKSPTVFMYATVFTGYEPLFINEQVSEKETFLAGGTNQLMTMNSSRYVIKDAPAIRSEPFMTSRDDYTSRLTSQLAAVNWPGMPGRRILESWEKVAEELDNMPKFGKQLSGFGAVRKQTEKITNGITDPMKQLEAVYDFIRTTIVWNNRNRVLATEDLDDILESKTGSSADINLLLTIMLRDAGIDAKPVLLSTRSNGKIQTIYPILDQFNYVITKATVGKREFLMDATDRFRPYYLLPQRVLNHTGYLVNEGKYEWVGVEPVAKGTETVSVDARLNADGSLEGSVEMRFADYSASDQRERHAAEKEDEYAKRLLRSTTSGIVVDSFKVGTKDSLSGTFLVRAQFSAPSYAQVLNEFIYFNPIIVDRSTENPFKLEKRLFPVDFAYPIAGTQTAQIQLPDGYVLKEIPSEAIFRLPKNGGLYTRRGEVNGNVLSVVTKFEINQAVYIPAQYAALRGFYDRIVAAENEQLVLEKQPSQLSPSPAVPVKQEKKSALKGKK